ncbi:MFS transporter [Lacinutrix sp.]|uniref:MFS transporter n=1 Tax=Lacinutrix sp. TaxID=1937692 RepID=UPI0035C7EA48
MKDQLKALKIIHLALSASVVSAYIFMTNLESIKTIFNVSIDSTEDYIFILLPIAAFIIGNFIFKFMLKSVDKKTSEASVFNSFQTASIARWAVLEGTAFIVLFMKPEFIISGIVIIIYLFLLMPTEEKFKKEINALQL